MGARSWLVIGYCLCAASAVGAADTWYVDNLYGDDTRDGRTARSVGASGPFRTIARALRAAGPGDRIELAETGKPYRESITLQGGRHSGTRESPFELVGNGAVLDGQQDVPVEAWHHVEGPVFAFRPVRKSFQTLYLDGRPAKRVAVSRGADKLPELPPLNWCLWRGEVYFAVQPGRLPGQYRLTYGALPVGITLYEVRNVLIRDITVRGFQLDGINAHDGVRYTLLMGVQAEGNGRSGISAGGASRLTLLRCVSRGNGVAQVRSESVARMRLRDCRIEREGPARPVMEEEQSHVEQIPR